MKTPGIELRPTRTGADKPYVAGTRISVEDIYIAYDLHGKTPDEIVEAWPFLTLAQVHAALAYYFDHQDEIQQRIADRDALVEQLKASIGPGPLERKLSNNDPDGDPVSS